MEATVTHSIDTLSYDELRSLIKQPISICTSLFLPIERAEPARQQHWIRLEDLLRQAEALLLAHGLSLAATQDLLAPAWQLCEERSFWKHQSAGLAIFVAPELFRVYRLPRAFEELAVVDARLHIAPLLPMLQSVAPDFERECAAAAERYQLLAWTHPAQATNYLRAIVPAASAGRIDTLFVASGQRHWGRFDPSTTTLTVHQAAEPRDTELVNYAIIHTILNSGTVYVVTPAGLPEAAPLAAIFRS